MHTSGCGVGFNIYTMNKLFPHVAEIRVSYTPAISDKPVIKSPLDAYVVLKQFFSDETIQLNERFVVMFLNKANRVLGVYPAHVGGITSTVVDIRLILSIALKTVSTAVVLCHNHPSGSLKPSQQDIELTKRIVEAAKYMEITVQDHLIISSEPGEYFSFAAAGLL